jgi:NAD(P)-dependent dehydrogenase (short-subunit alcohol dehydrogenase family)
MRLSYGLLDRAFNKSYGRVVDRYAGKRVVIIGGTSGIGRATAERLSAEGARVLVTGRSPETLAGLGPGIVGVRSDAADLSDVDALAGTVAAEFGAVDALFVNAGITRPAAFVETTEQLYDEVFAVNTKGPYFTVQRLAPLLTDGAGIVLTTSVSDVKGQPGTSVYAATKAALRSMTRSLARELAPRNIRVNAVSPGPIDTGILDRSLGPERAAATKAEMAARNPMQRFGRPDEVAAAVLFLAFDATFTTGSELAVDGGVSQL